MQLGLLVEGGAERRMDRLAESSRGLFRFTKGGIPRTVETHQLGAVDEALTAVLHEIRLGVAPTAERR